MVFDDCEKEGIAIKKRAARKSSWFSFMDIVYRTLKVEKIIKTYYTRREERQECRFVKIGYDFL